MVNNHNQILFLNGLLHIIYKSYGADKMVQSLQADKPSAFLIKIRSVILVLFVRVSLCGSVANFIIKLCVADIIYCIFKDADTDGGTGI